MPSALERSTGMERKRVREKKMRKMTGQAIPTRRRLAPVLLAMARGALSGWAGGGAVTASRRMTGGGRAPRTGRAITVQWRTGVGLICAEDAPCGGAWASGGAGWVPGPHKNPPLGDTNTAALTP